jgi:hypothetical protein
MAKHKKRKNLSFILLACVHTHRFSSAYSHVRKIAIPEQPIGLEELQSELEKSDDFDLRINERNRRLKSGKYYKDSKRSKKSKKYGHSYYEESYYTKKSKKYGHSYYERSYYTNRYGRPQIPVPSPTCKLLSVNREKHKAP